MKAGKSHRDRSGQFVATSRHRFAVAARLIPAKMGFWQGIQTTRVPKDDRFFLST
jgi:hypothetical protein